jgi:hypothetical protein
MLNGDYYLCCICPSAWKNSAPIGHVLMKYDIYFNNLSMKFYMVSPTRRQIPRFNFVHTFCRHIHKILNGDYYLCLICPSARKGSAPPIGWILMKYGIFLKKFVCQIKVSLKSGRNKR